jgi:orotidine-5'-phosphate decarboxylase
MKPQLIVALDVPTAADVAPILHQLPEAVSFYKVGLELFAAEGPRTLAPLQERGKSIFLDLKLHDIPRTVERAVKSAARHRVALLTVHASGGRAMLQAAAEAAREAGEHRPLIVAVTALTSLDANDLRDIGVTRSLSDHILALGELAISAGVDGLVCSPNEAAAFRRTLGPAPILVTPGIRPAGGELGDQKRVATPAFAIQSGATFLVVGRPILDAPDPRAAAEGILREIQTAAPATANAGGPGTTTTNTANR